MQSVAILDKKKYFMLISFNFDLSFFQNNFHDNVPLDRGFPVIPNLSNIWKFPEVLVVGKFSTMNKNRTSIFGNSIKCYHLHKFLEDCKDWNYILH